MIVGRVGADRERRPGTQPPETNQAPKQSRQLRISGHGRHLVLPEIGEPGGQLVEVGGVGHAPEV